MQFSQKILEIFVNFFVHKFKNISMHFLQKFKKYFDAIFW